MSDFCKSPYSEEQKQMTRWTKYFYASTTSSLEKHVKCIRPSADDYRRLRLQKRRGRVVRQDENKKTTVKDERYGTSFRVQAPLPEEIKLTSLLQACYALSCVHLQSLSIHPDSTPAQVQNQWAKAGTESDMRAVAASVALLTFWNSEKREFTRPLNNLWAGHPLHILVSS